MTHSVIHALVEDAISAWEHGKAEQFANLFTTTGEFVVPGNRWVGQNEIQQVTAEFCADHAVKITVRQILIQDHQAAVEWLWQETNRTTGAYHQADDVIMITTVDNKIQRWREYIDTQSSS